MKNKYRLLKVFVTVILLAFMLNFSLSKFNNKPMQKVSVNYIPGKERVFFVDRNNMEREIKAMNTRGIIATADIPAMEKKVLQNPYIDSANVYINLAGEIHVDIAQKVPFVRIIQGEKSFYVDQRLTPFPLSSVYSHPVMLAKGDIPPQDYPALKTLIEQIEADTFLKNFIIGIEYQKKNYNLISQIENVPIELGNLENTTVKLQGLKAFFNSYLSYQDPAKYKRISVKFDNQIVTTLKGAAIDSMIQNEKITKQKLATTGAKTIDAVPVPISPKQNISPPVKNTVHAQPKKAEVPKPKVTSPKPKSPAKKVKTTASTKVKNTTQPKKK